MEILTENHTKVLPEKYAKVVLQIATLEERISAMMSFGFTEKSKMLSDNLVQLLQAVKDEYERDQKKKR
jgi:hypothetical protein